MSNKKTKIIIVGAGFAGVFLAKSLLKQFSKKELATINIELINNYNYFVFQPLLPEVSAGIINPHDAVSPLRILLPKIKHRLAVVKGVNRDDKTIQILQGKHKKIFNITYDHLIISCGQISSLSLPGFSESFAMKNLSDAFLLRNQVLKNLELADVTNNIDVKDSSLTFVVAGGGFSGVETIGELQDMVIRAIKYYPNIKKQDIKFILLQKDNRILTQLPESLSHYAHKKLTKRGIDIRLNIGVSSIGDGYLTTDMGVRINTRTIITTIGSAANMFVKNNFKLERGKIIVNEYMQVENSDNIWSLGDATLVKMIDKKGVVKYAPPTAQFAVAEAKVLAKNIKAELFNKPKKTFYFKPLGQMASLGSYQGVVEILGFKLFGLLAWFMWRGIYITKLPGKLTQLRVLMNWFFDYIFPRTLVQISPVKKQDIKQINFYKNDVICEIGDLITDFSIILSGKVLCELEHESFTLSTQDFFGYEISNYYTAYNMRITALEDTVILKMNWREFLKLKQNFKLFNDLLNNTKFQKSTSSGV